MSTVRRLVPAISVVIGLAAPALAQPGAEEVPPQPPPPGGGTVVVIQPEPGQGAQSQQPPVRAVVAPMNEDWSNVSHINGHPVKVGERGDYLYTFRKTNIASNPIGWMVGIYGLSVSHAVSQNVVVRADGNLFNTEEDGGYEVGLTVPIYFRRAYQGPFLEAGLMIRQLEACHSCETMEPANVGPQAMFGWHWTFDSGLNVATAFGAFRPMNDGKTVDDVEPAFYFRIGYALQ